MERGKETEEKWMERMKNTKEGKRRERRRVDRSVIIERKETKG